MNTGPTEVAAFPRMVRFLGHKFIPCDTGLVIAWTLETGIKGAGKVFECDDFIDDAFVDEKTACLVDSYQRVKDIVVLLADAMEQV